MKIQRFVNKFSTKSFGSLFKKNKNSFFIASSLFVGSVASFAIQASSNKKQKGPLHPEEFREFELISRVKKTHDTDLFRFRLQPDEALNMPITSCLVVSADLGEEKPTSRPYTPTTKATDKGYFDLVIKGYPDGKLSKHFHTLQPGAKLAMKGPYPKLKYKENMKKEIGMIAGGTGITPMFQLIQYVLDNPNDETKITLLYGSKSPKDVILKNELDSLAANHENFEVVYVVDEPESSWKGQVGYIDLSKIKKFLPSPSDDSLILICGPPPMVKAIAGPKTKDYKQGEVKGVLKEAGFNEDNVYKF